MLAPCLMWQLATYAITAATTPQATWEEAHQAYESGHYSQAVTHYQSLTRDGYTSGWVYYNLGNSYLRNKELGRAIAAYLRADAHLPRQADIRANLNFARSQTKDALAPIEPASLYRALFAWHYALNADETTAAWAVCNAFLWFAVALLMHPRRPRYTGAITAILAVMWVATCSSAAIKHLAPQDIVVVTRPEIDVHAGTQVDTVVRFVLHEGSEARVVGSQDTQENWLRIEVADGKQGWVEAADVTRVTL